MKHVIALALVAAIAGGAQAQVQTTTEKTVETQSSTNGAVNSSSEKTTVKTNTTAYVDRLNAAYKFAGVPEADIVRLRDIDTRYIEARRVNPNLPVETYYTQQTRILKPAQVEKVRTYLHQHPAPANAKVVTTYEAVPTRSGVEVNTPLGSVGVGVNTGEKVVERKEVVPAE